MDHDDLDEDIERLNIILQDEEGEAGESDGELRVLEYNEEEYYSNASRPSTSSDVTASSLPTTSVCTDADESLFRFDPNTITAETCLAMNRAYQEVLLDTLRQIELSLIENRNKQKELSESVDEKVKKTDIRQTSKDCITEHKYLPYFNDKNGEVPPYNEDVKLKEQMNEDKQHMQPKLGWSKLQRKSLLDAIKLDALEQVIRPLLNKQEVEMEKLGKCKNSEEIEAAKARIEKIQQEIKQKQELSADELLKNVVSSRIDFMKISIFTFNNKFSVTECESMWNNVLRPGINRDKWTEEEEAELKKLATKYEMRNWKQIANELGTNRTPFQCLQHYQQNNIVYTNSDWTEEEDELLKEVVETCTYGVGKIHWHQVAYYIDGRSDKHCMSRWGRINPTKNLGRWSKEEDAQLLNAIKTYGGVIEWTKVQEHVPTRNAAQCRERYVNSMGGCVHFRPWTYEDDKKLLTLHKEFGDHWTTIAEHFDRRNDNMVLLRYKRLMKWQRLMDGFYSQHRKVQRQLKHHAFKFGKQGMLIPKSGLKLSRVGGRRGRPRNIACVQNNTKKTELERLKETGGKEAEAALEDVVQVKKEPVEEDDEEKEDVEEEETAFKNTLQPILDVFVATHNVEAEDYFKQLRDKVLGEIVVPRPPPIKGQRLNKVSSVWRKHNRLTDVIQQQIETYINRLQETMEDESKEEPQNDLDLYEQIAKHVQVEDEAEKKRMIRWAFGGKNPCNLSVRELLNISKCFKEHGRPPKNPKNYDLEPWEVEGSDENNGGEESSSEEEVEEISDEEEPKPKRPQTQRQKEHTELMKKHLKKYHELEKQIKHCIQVKMDPSELTKVRGRRKQYLMYSKKILMKYRGLDEERRMNRKSLVLLMKTLDVNAKSAYFKAKRGKRKLSAMAFLKSVEKANLKRAKTRRQKTEIQEAAQVEANMNSEISEVSDFLIELKDELKVGDAEEERSMSMKEDTVEEDDGQTGYNKKLPFIPPNQTNLKGMRTLLLEHRYLIDQAGFYFHPEELKQKLYVLKQRGPNPLMGVLNAIGKTETVTRRRGRGNVAKSAVSGAACQRQLEGVRQTTAYQQLKARFQSVFTWPALMATIPPPRGIALPKALKEIVEERKASVADVIIENVGDDAAGSGDVGVGSGEVAIQSEEAVEDIEDLPEEEAVERLVDKIMAEYEKERMKKKRILPTTKRYRNFSEMRKQGLVDKERTKILKRLGLYEKMQEFKRSRQQAEQSVAATVASVSGVDTASGPSGSRPTATATRPEGDENTSGVATEAGNSMMITSEGCQTDMNPDDIDTTEVVVNTEAAQKRKPGRPIGAKTKCYNDSGPVRKSRRAAEAPLTVKREQDYVMSPPKKKTKRRNVSQYNLVRNLIPEKMSQIASQIPDLPILNEPVQEKVQKPPRKPKQKPVKEKKKVGKSKFGTREPKSLGTGRRGPKTNRILKQFRETERLTAAAKSEVISAAATKVQIKTEPHDADGMRDDRTHYNVVVTEDHLPLIEKLRSKVMTSRARKKLNEAKEIPNSRPENGSVAVVSGSGLNGEQGHATNELTQKMTSGNGSGKLQSDNASVRKHPGTKHSVESLSNGSIQSQSNKLQDSIQSTNGKQQSNIKSSSGKQQDNIKSSSGKQQDNIQTLSGKQQDNIQSSNGKQQGKIQSRNGKQQDNIQSKNDEQQDNAKSKKGEQQKIMQSSNDKQQGNVQSTNDKQQDNIQSTSDKQQDKQQLMDNTEVRKPFLVAVPVMIDGIQQVAMIPFIPDKEGKITLPNGKKIDATDSKEPGAVSLPMINLDQPVNVIKMNPNNPTSENQAIAKPCASSSDVSGSDNGTQTTSQSSDAQ